MYIRLFESGPGYDSIELNIVPSEWKPLPYKETPLISPEMAALSKVITTLFQYTDIEEIGIGRERDAKVYKKQKKDK